MIIPAEKNFGVFIQTGISHWQVFQQDGNGAAAVRITGKYRNSAAIGGAVQPLLRLVRESDNSIVINWTGCAPRDNRADSWKDWNITISIPSGGPYRLETALLLESNRWSTEFMLRGEIVHHVSTGHLFVIAGQSNAAGYGRECAPDNPEYGISMLRINGNWDIATHPLHDASGNFGSILADNLHIGHSPWLAVAKSLRQRLGTPVGLIPVAVGGSGLDMWQPGSGALYPEMLKQIELAGGKFSGLIWYQGCTDASSGAKNLAEEYERKFCAMLDALREQTGCPEIIATVQLNCFNTASAAEADGWRQIRDIQWKIAARIPGCVCIPTYDLSVMSDDIHNSSYNNLAVAARTADILSAHFMKNAAAQAPYLANARLAAGQTSCLLEFGGCSGRIVCRIKSNGAMPFYFTSRNCEIFYPSAINQAADNTLELSFEGPEQPELVSLNIDTLVNPLPVYDENSRLPVLAFHNALITGGRNG